jgi:transposase
MRVTRVVPHLSLQEVKKRIDTAEKPLYRRRWRVIYCAQSEEQYAEVIARHCGVAKDTVHKLISRYNRFGVEAVETPGKGGRRRYYLTREQEKEVLLPFFERAEKGEIATNGEIHQAYEAAVARIVDESTISRLLTRHGWRKVVPRPKHPKADREQQETFKKTSQRSSNRPFPQNL